MGMINPWSSKSLYLQIKEAIERLISEGKLKEGDPIPSERELCEKYNVSSTTARRALQELVREGWIYRRVGIGSFVASDTRSSNLLMLVVGFLESDWRKYASLFSEMIGGIAKVAWEQKANFSVAQIPGHFSDIQSYLYGVIQEGIFDGVLLRTADDLSPDYLDPFFEREFPYVVIKRYLPDRKINCVVNDDVQGGFIATKHLIELGHTRIGLIAPQNTAVGRDRVAGYRKALSAHDLTLDPSLVYAAGDMLEETGCRAAEQLLQLPEPPTAIFAPSDILATGVYEAIKEKSLRIPEKISVIGFDNIPSAAIMAPPLTTVSTSYFEFGSQSAFLLLNLIRKKVHAPQQVLIENLLVVRASTASPSNEAESSQYPNRNSPTIRLSD